MFQQFCIEPLSNVTKNFTTWSLDRIKYLPNLYTTVALCISFLCFLPLFLGYSVIDSCFYADKSWISESNLTTAVIANLATTLPNLLDGGFDYLSVLWSKYRKLTQEQTVLDMSTLYVPFRETIALLVIPDILLLAWILPYRNYDFYVILFQIRDLLYVYALFTGLKKFSNPIWTSRSFIFVCLPFMISNLITSFINFVLCIDFRIALYFFIVATFFVLVGFISLAVHASWWIQYVCGMKIEDFTIKTYMTSMYVVVYVGFLSYSYGMAYYNYLGAWGAFGNTYGIINCYVIAGCTLFLTVVSSRCARVDAMDNMNSLKEMFMRYISHEIRTPLNTVFVGLQILCDGLKHQGHGQEDSSLVETAEDSKQSCQIAIGILNDMLLYDKIVNGFLSLEMRLLDPLDFIPKVLRPFRIQAGAAGIDLKFEHSIAETNLPILLRGDPYKLAQVFRNLISNSLKFTGSNGSICVTVSLEEKVLQDSAEESDLEMAASSTKSMSMSRSSRSFGDCLSSWLWRRPPLVVDPKDSSMLCIRVSDTGAGISVENQTRLFKGAVQFNPGVLQKGQGTGLGLYITKQIVSQHSGDVSVHSLGEGEGCTFTIRLPCLLGAEESEELFDLDAADPSPPRSSPLSNQSSAPRLDSHLLTRRGDAVSENFQSPPHVSDNFNGYNVHGHEELRQSPTMIPTISTEEVEEKKADAILMQRQSYIRDEGTSLYDTFDSTGQQATKRNVLVVDDSDMTRKMVCKLLEATKKFRCEQAEDGSVAVEMIRRQLAHHQHHHQQQQHCVGQDHSWNVNMYDMVLVDYQMPVMDGPTAVAEIRRLGFQGIILGLTGNALKKDQDVMTEAGADGVLTKPLSMDMFWDCLRIASGRRGLPVE